MQEFEKSLRQKLQESIYNDFGAENYDVERFGVLAEPKKDYLLKLKLKVKKALRWKKKHNIDSAIRKLTHLAQMEYLFSILNKEGKILLIELIAYRVLGRKKVKLSINDSKFEEQLELVDSLMNASKEIDPGFMHFVLYEYDLTSIGKPIKLYFTKIGVMTDFILEQYAYKLNNKTVIEAESGDTVLDLGACWGDTALYFAEKVGKAGQVKSFEFIPNNIDLFNKNINLNPNLKSRIQLVTQPVTDKTGERIYFMDNGPGSRVSVKPFKEQTGEATTITIDDFVEKEQLEKVDFIKMDIEGAEPYALKGAIKTIMKYKPKLAIAIYHSLGDFVSIPKWIADLNIGYELYLGHYTIHSEETIIFAKVKYDSSN